MKRNYLTPQTRTKACRFEQNLLGTNLLPGSGSEQFSDDGEFNWGDNN